MTTESSLKPFDRGDIFVGATVLNNADDDHAGDGRIIQYDSDLNEKGVLWTSGTTHLVGGLRFAPDGTLWAFDSQAWAVVRVSPEGEQLPPIDFGDRSFSNINFAPDGNVYLGEHLVGDTIKLPPDRPLGTTLPHMTGTQRFGDGHVFKFTPDGKLLKEYATESHGGMPGFLGVTSATLAPDGRTLVYNSELGSRLFRYDLEADAQLTDLISYAADSGNMTITEAYQPDGGLLYIYANFRKGFFLQALDDAGSATRTYDMEGPGWASLGISIESGRALVGNFFTGTVIKMDLGTGETLARAETEVQRSLAGIAQYPG
jgi:outer membrane protein assembly factor BamB